MRRRSSDRQGRDTGGNQPAGGGDRHLFRDRSGVELEPGILRHRPRQQPHLRSGERIDVDADGAQPDGHRQRRSARAYDGLGRRETSTGTGGGSPLVFDHDGSTMIGWTSISLGAFYDFLAIPGGGAVAGSFTSGGSTTTWVPLIDASGSTIALVNAASTQSAPATTYSYDPAGTPSVSGAANDWPFLYQGGEKVFTDPGPLYYSERRRAVLQSATGALVVGDQPDQQQRQQWRPGGQCQRRRRWWRRFESVPAYYQPFSHLGFPNCR